MYFDDILYYDIPVRYGILLHFLPFLYDMVYYEMFCHLCMTYFDVLCHFLDYIIYYDIFKGFWMT